MCVLPKRTRGGPGPKVVQVEILTKAEHDGDFVHKELRWDL